MNGFHRRFYGAVTLGERGQIVIPQEARDEMGLRPGEKLLVFRQGPRGAGLSIMRAEDVSRFVADAMKALSRLTEAVSGGAWQHEAQPYDREDESAPPTAQAGSAPTTPRGPGDGETPQAPTPDGRGPQRRGEATEGGGTRRSE